MDTSHAPEPFRGQLLRHRGRTGLIQRELAARAGISVRSIQDWESGVNCPTAELLQALTRALLEAGGLTAGQEAFEARELWAAARREGSRMHVAFDEEWFARILASRAPQRSDTPRLAAVEPESGAVEHTADWGEAPDVLGFLGRHDEVALLRRWVLEERCRLVAVLGMGGIGKTSLAARVAQDVAPSFARVYWRSMRDAPPVGEWLAGAIGFLSDHRLPPPALDSDRMVALLQLLRERRCLLVLDNCETLFEPGQPEGRYRAGMGGYGRLLQSVGDTSHDSCLVVTSREAPLELAMLSGAVRSLELTGLGVDDAQKLLAPKHLSGTAANWAQLTATVGGNGLALKVVGERIREVFAGDIGVFLEEGWAGGTFGSIRRLLEEQVGVALSADGRIVVSTGADGTAHVWETTEGRALGTLHGHSGGVWAVALSGDGQLLVSSGADGMVRLWETDTQRPIAALEGHTGAVWCVAVSDDGQLVASGSFDGTVRLWAASTGACLRILRPERRYERLDITGLTGITGAQRAALVALGAVEQTRETPARA